jgi:hypothetical protein
MSIASPKTRSELKSYIKYKLGEPVLQINISDEQLEIAIQDAIQFFIEKNHFNGTDKVFYRFKITEEFLKSFYSAEQTIVNQDNGLTSKASGQVTALTLVSGGSGYPEKTGNINRPTTTTGNGKNLTVNYGDRDINGGLTGVTIYDTGYGYTVGDLITVPGGTVNAVFQVTTVSDSVSTYGYEVFEQQRNYIIVPPDIIGISKIISVPASAFYGMAGAFTATGIPVLFGLGGLADPSGYGAYDVTSTYTIFKTYMEDLGYMLLPELSYDFNMRNHKLYLNFNMRNRLGAGKYLVMECDKKVDFGENSDVWGDKFLKQLSTAYARKAWGINLTKYNNVQLPGGISLNGQQIYNEAVREISEIEADFYLTGYEPPLGFIA